MKKQQQEIYDIKLNRIKMYTRKKFNSENNEKQQ